MELVYSEQPERQEVARAARPGPRHPGPGRRHGLPSRRWSPARRRPWSRSPGAIVGNGEDARDVAQMVFLRVWERDPPLRRDATPSTPGSTGSRRTSRSTSCAARAAASGRTARRCTSCASARSRRRRRDPRRRGRASSRGSSRPSPAGSRRSRRRPSCCARWRTARRSEIAEILGCGESTVRNHLFNARRILRKEIGAALSRSSCAGRPLSAMSAALRDRPRASFDGLPRATRCRRRSAGCCASTSPAARSAARAAAAKDPTLPLRAADAPRRSPPARRPRILAGVRAGVALIETERRIAAGDAPPVRGRRRGGGGRGRCSS